MKPISEAARMQRTAKNQFGFRVLGTDSRHHSRPNRSINYVSHQLTYSAKEERDCTYISQNIVDAIKECRAIFHLQARVEYGYRKVRTYHLIPTRQIATGCCRLPGGPVSKRLTACLQATDQP